MADLNEALWDEYKRIWGVAAEICDIEYTGSLAEGVAGGYVPSLRKIYIGRKDRDGRSAPEPTFDSRMAYEACIIIHEMSHAQSHEIGGSKFDQYLKALRLWNFCNMDGTLLKEDERMLIFDEETRVEMLGIRTAGSFSKEIREEYTRTMIENISAYSTLLWNGTWPDGKRQRWEGSKTFTAAMQYLDALAPSDPLRKKAAIKR